MSNYAKTKRKPVNHNLNKIQIQMLRQIQIIGTTFIGSIAYMNVIFIFENVMNQLINNNNRYIHILLHKNNLC